MQVLNPGNGDFRFFILVFVFFCVLDLCLLVCVLNLCLVCVLDLRLLVLSNSK